MTRAIPPVVLDEVLLGADDAEHRAAWKALVSRPGGGSAIRQATKTRTRLDLMADLLPLHPWLAEAIRVWRVARRTAKALLDFRVVATFPEFALARQLAPDAEPVDERTPIEWGDVRELRMQVGERVAFVVKGDSKVAWWYETGAGRGALPTAAWRLQTGEAPVVIHAFAGMAQDASFDQCVQGCVTHALIVLNERT